MNALLFDLDGTLTDSAPGIIKSVQYALDALHAPMPTDEVLRRFLGPPLWDSFPRYCHFDEVQTKEAVRLYREYYAVHGIYEQELYDGIPELIHALSNAEIPLFVATAKPDMYAGKILEHMNLDHHFIDICGATADSSRADKTSIIGHVIAKHGIDPNTSWMIGDKEHDIHGAHAHAMKSIACLYGYGTMQDIEESKPTHICSSVKDLQILLTKLTMI
ncbi:MAG: HAD hydrolase-like protein [Candidatus Kapaibacteriota bacterium]